MNLKSLGRLAWLWAPVIVYALFLVYLSTLTVAPWYYGVLSAYGGDKVLHVGAYFLLCLLSIRALNNGFDARLRFTPIASALVFSISFGLIEELQQAMIPGREASLWDFGADVFGSLLAGGFWYLVSSASSLFGFFQYVNDLEKERL